MTDLILVPFLAGLPLALTLPGLGQLLRLRDEWLAALGLAHLAGATALVAQAVHLPGVLGAPLGALLGGAAKSMLGARGNAAFALMILAGWCATLLIANALGEAVAHALIEGQLYFADVAELIAALSVSLVVRVALPWLTPRLVRARIFPLHETANRKSAWRWHLGFDLLAALTIAIATATLGLMAAFALVFVPPWIAHRRARNWRHADLLATGIGLTAYVLAFATALALDQPFGPILVLILLTLLGLDAVHAKLRPRPHHGRRVP